MQDKNHSTNCDENEPEVDLGDDQVIEKEDVENPKITAQIFTEDTNIKNLLVHLSLQEFAKTLGTTIPTTYYPPGRQYTIRRTSHTLDLTLYTENLPDNTTEINSNQNPTTSATSSHSSNTNKQKNAFRKTHHRTSSITDKAITPLLDINEALSKITSSTATATQQSASSTAITASASDNPTLSIANLNTDVTTNILEQVSTNPATQAQIM
jgi:hypothetical protein